MKSEMARCGNLNQTTNHFKLIVPAGMQRKEQYVTGPIQVIASPVWRFIDIMLSLIEEGGFGNSHQMGHQLMNQQPPSLSASVSFSLAYIHIAILAEWRTFTVK